MLGCKRFWSLVFDFLFLSLDGRMASHVWTNRKLSTHELAVRIQKFSSLELERAVTINVNNNSISALPEELLTLPNLKTLNIMDNELTELPLWISKLSNLRILALDRNLLNSLPDSLANLNLEILTVSKNKLSHLPSNLRALSNLKQVDFRNNENLPKEIQVSILNSRDKTQNFLQNHFREISSPVSASAPPGRPSTPPPINRRKSDFQILKTKSENQVCEYFESLGASKESLELLSAEQIDGEALFCFSSAELRENFHFSLGVIKKHESNISAKSESGNAETEEEISRRIEAEKRANEAQNSAKKSAKQLEYEKSRRITAERERDANQRQIERDEVQRNARIGELFTNSFILTL